MKNTKSRKILSILLSIIMIMTTCAIAFSVSAETDETAAYASMTATDSGDCSATGSSVSWAYYAEIATLVISGTGTMASFSTSSNSANGAWGGDRPWYDYLTIIETVIVEEGVIATGTYAFRDMTSVTSVSLPSSLTTLGAHSMWGCSSLKSLEIPEGMTSILAGVFNTCTSLEYIYIPSTVTSIGNNNFVSTPDSVVVFYGGSSWSSITVGTTGNTVPSTIILGIKPYEEYQMGTTTTYWSLGADLTLTVSGTGAMPDYTKAGGDQPWLTAITSIKNIVIEEGITAISDYAFYTSTYQATSLESVSLPSTLINIGYNAFYQSTLSGLLVIPDNVTTVEYGAFSQNYSLTGLVIGASVKTVGQYAFGGNTFSTVYIPATYTTISSTAFNNAVITTAYFAASESTYTISSSQLNAATKIFAHTCETGTLLEEITPSTCGEYGTGYFQCSECSRTYVSSLTEYGSAHSYNSEPDANSVAIAATCTQGTGNTYTCTGCGQSAVLYGTDIDSSNHTGTQRKYIDDDGNVQTYWTCCETTSYIDDLAELILEYNSAVTSFSALVSSSTYSQNNQLSGSGYITRTYTISSYSDYAQMVEILEAIQLAALELIENSEDGYGSDIYSTSAFDFAGWSSYKLRDTLVSDVNAAIDILVADTTNDYNTDYDVTNLIQGTVLGANNNTKTPTQSAYTYSAQHDTSYIATTLTTTDYSGYYNSGVSYADLSTSATFQIDMSLQLGSVDGATVCVMTVDSAADITLKTETSTSMSAFETAADEYIAALTSFNSTYSTAAALFAAGGDADYTAVEAAETTLATYGDVETFLAGNTQYAAYTEKLDAIAEHSLNHTEYTGATVAATCCSTGYTQTLCEDCDFVSYEYTKINSDAHLYSETEKVVVAPTCTEAGGTYEYWYCCGSLESATLVEGTEIAATDHTYVVTESIAATCCSVSSTTEVCTSCGNEVVTVGTEFDTENHVYGEGVFTDGETCTDNGYTTYTCTTEGCGGFYVEDETGADHVYVLTEEAAATCTEEGHDTYECKNCDATYTDTYEATGHYFWYFVSSTSGDCGHQSSVTLKCADCDETETTYGDYDYSNHVDTDGDGTCDCGASDGTITPEPDVDDGDDDDDSSSGSSNLSFWETIVKAFEDFFAMIAALFTF